jgi:DinB superfamily
MTLPEIITASEKIFRDFTDYCRQVPDEKFFFQPADKWSIAQNVDHLTISMRQTRLAYALPKFIVRLYTGKPNRPGRSYDELVTKYKNKLAAGGKASGVFVPKPIRGISKEALISKWEKSVAAYFSALRKQDDKKLDNYLAPHPLLGKITLRELCYFTIYHTEHHLNIIKQRNQ